MTIEDQLQQRAAKMILRQDPRIAVNRGVRRSARSAARTGVHSVSAGEASSGLPDPTGTKVVSFVAGDVDKTTWLNKRSSYPGANATVYNDQADYDLSQNGRATVGNPRATTGGNNGAALPIGYAATDGNSSSTGGDGSLGQLWRYSRGYEIPLMNDAGQFVCYRETGFHDPHCQIVFKGLNSSSAGFSNRISWIPGDHYEKKCTLVFPDAPTDYDVDWIVLDQLRGDGYSGPQIGLYLIDGVFTVRRYDPLGSPSPWELTPLNINLSQGVSLDFRWDIILSQVDGVALTKLWANKKLVYSSTKANYAGTASIENTVGNYQSADEAKTNTVLIDSYELWHEAA